MTLHSLISRRPDDLSIRRRLLEDEPFSALQRAMNEMLNDFGRNWGSEMPESSFNLRLDVSEDDKEFHVVAELPGVKEQDIDISVSNGSLTIRGEKKAEKTEKEQDYYRHERSFGSFSRTVPMPEYVDREHISAKFRDGVLVVDLPKSKEAQRAVRHIKIKH